MFGWAGLGGERQELRVYGGWNQNGAAYINHRTGGLPLLLGGSLFYYGPGGQTRLGLPVDTRPLEGTLNIAVYAGPDFLAGLEMTVPLGENRNELPWLYAANPYLSYTFIFPGEKMPLTMNINARGTWYPQYQTGKAVAAAGLHIPLSLRFEWAVLAAGGVAPNNIPPVGLFDLYNGITLNREDAGIIRSGSDNLRASGFVLGSTELRFTLMDEVIARMFRMKIVLLAFADGAEIFASQAATAAWADAFGLGLRLNFDNPVFAWFSFSYGWDHEGQGRFIFSGTKGF
jgi:hypothetical protein